MHLVNKFFYLNNQSLSSTWEKRKSFFGITRVFEVQKLAFGFFIDRFEARTNGENREFFKLKKFQWCAGSISSERLKNLLALFLSSKDLTSRLSAESLDQIRSFLHYLDCQKEENFLIDLKRSQNIGLLALMLFGASSPIFFGSKNPQIDSTITDLSQRAIERVKKLSLNEKAFFFVGTLLHETQLGLERKADNRFELTYYDSQGDHPLIYLAKAEDLLTTHFWISLYLMKFKRIEAEEIKLFLDKTFRKISDAQKLIEAGYSPQLHNTCHIRSPLALLKDLMVRHTSLPIEKALVEWNFFKEDFGSFLLRHEKLENVTLGFFAEKKNEKWQARSLFRAIACQIIEEKEEAKSLEAYQKAITQIRPQLIFNSNLQGLQPLEKFHKGFLQYLKKIPLSPEKLAPYFQSIHDPLVLLTLSLFEKQQEECTTLYQKQLQDELSLLSLGRGHRALGAIGERSKKFFGFVPKENFVSLDFFPNFEENELQQYLDRFEAFPEELSQLSLKPSFSFIFPAALQQGKFSQVERIFKKLAKEDQGFVLAICSRALYFIPLLPHSLYEDLLNYKDSPLAKILFPFVAIKCIQQENYIDFFELASLYPGLLPDDTWNIIQQIPADKIEKLCAWVVKKGTSEIPYRGNLFKILFRTLHGAYLKKDMSPIESVKSFIGSIPEISIILTSLFIDLYYSQGKFTEIETLSGESYEEIQLPSHLISDKNFPSALDLLKTTENRALQKALMLDLIRFAERSSSEKLLIQIFDTLFSKEFYFPSIFEEITNQLSPFILSSTRNHLEKSWLPIVIGRFLYYSNSKETFFLLNGWLSSLNEEEKRRFDSSFEDIPLLSEEFEKQIQEAPSLYLSKKILSLRFSSALSQALSNYEKAQREPSKMAIQDYLFYKERVISLLELMASGVSDSVFFYREWIEPLFQKHLQTLSLKAFLGDILKQISNEELHKASFASLISSLPK